MSDNDWSELYWFEALERLTSIQAMLDVSLIEDDEDGNEIWHPAIGAAGIVEDMDEIRAKLALAYEKIGQAMGLEPESGIH